MPETTWVPTWVLKEAAEMAEYLDRNARNSSVWQGARTQRLHSRYPIGVFIERDVHPNQLEMNLEGGSYNATR